VFEVFEWIVKNTFFTLQPVEEYSKCLEVIIDSSLTYLVMSVIALKIILAGEIAIIGFMIIVAVVIIVWMRKRRKSVLR
tara:strand:- start:409 stop:645 length:237 start_codon:yes stop_codon:yes gene_type:complete